MQNADLGRASWPAFRAVAMLYVATVSYFVGVRLLVPEVPRFLVGPLYQSDSVLSWSAGGPSWAAVSGRGAAGCRGLGAGAGAAWPTAAGLPVAAAILVAAQALGVPVFIMLTASRLPTGGHTGAVAAVAAGCDIGYSAAAAGLSPVAGRTAYPAMLWASALVTAPSARLALRVGDSSKRRETP